MVRRRADVALPRLAAAQGRDVGRRLAPGQLAALAGLGALGDLDLELVGAREVGGGHPEPRRGDLLDPRVVTATVGARLVPGRILATLAGVRRAARALDADRQRLVRLRAQRADAHRRHDEAADDRPGVLDLVERHRDAGMPDAQLVARHRPVARRSRQGGPVAGQGGVDVERRAVGMGRREDLDLAGDARREQVGFAVGPEPGEAGVGQAWLATGGGLGDGQGGRAAADLARAEVGQRRPAGPGRRVREAARDDGSVEVDDVDERPADVRGDGADAHPGQRLAQAGLERRRQDRRRPRTG